MRYLALLALFGLQCKQPATQSHPVDTVVIAYDTNHTIASYVPPKPPEDKSDSLLVIPDTATIEVGQFRKRTNLAPGNEGYDFCNKWKLDSGTLVAIIRGFKPINANLWHYGYDSFDCELIGDVKINGVSYEMYLNAGSWFFLYAGGYQYRFGDEKNAFNKYFLEGNVYDQYPEN